MGWIQLDGAVNVRDLGGLPAAGGRLVAGRRLLRADNLQDLTAADVRLLVSELGVTTVVDLRSPGEVAAEGPAPLTAVPSVRHAYHPVLAESGRATDVVADALAIGRERSRSRYPANLVTGHYLGYLADRPDEVTGALRSVATAPGAALVHCAAGKDRTGVVVALALTVAGVQRDAVVADYTATGERVEAVMTRLRASPTYAADLKNRPDADHFPHPATMAAFLAEVDARYGGVLPWLESHGFGAADVSALRAKLLDP